MSIITFNFCIAGTKLVVNIMSDIEFYDCTVLIYSNDN